MTDRELLEAAAKAAGIDVYWDEEKTETMLRQVEGARWTKWNPLTDDGDALRLAVRLRLDIGFPRPDVVWSFSKKGEVTREVDFNDPYVATRRAIVRAAAEIGSKT
jgi:hypothetical protein